jgi:hypothetical protein
MYRGGWSRAFLDRDDIITAGWRAYPVWIAGQNKAFT